MTDPDRALTRDQELWIMTAHPDSLDLYDDAPAWLVMQCLQLGLIKPGGKPGTWRLTEAGYGVWRELAK